MSAGEAWPSGDEDRMRELADAWQALADTVSETLGQADPAVMKILQSWGGGAGEAFGGLWNQIGVDPNTGLPLIQEISAAYAAGCDQAALEIEYAKLTVLIAVIITVIAVFVALLMAWLGGVSAGAIPGILAGGRQAVTIAFRRLIAQMGRQLLTRAGMRAALRLAGTRIGQTVTSQGFRQGLNRLGRELLEEIGEELIIDVGAQAYQMHTGERRQWDGNRTLTAGVGGAYGAVLGTGMNWAGRRAAPRMPFSFSPSQLSFRGSGMVRWGSTSLASGAQNAVISPAASVLANGTINGQWAMPGADAFLGGFASGAGRTGATLAGGATGNLMARGTNAILGRMGLDVTPNVGPAGGTDPGLGVGGANGLGDLGGGANGTGAGSTGGGSTSGAGAAGGGTGSAADGGAATSGSDSASGVGGSGSDGAGSASGAGGTTDAGATDTGNGASQSDTGTVPDSGAGSISLAPPTADGSAAPSSDATGAPAGDPASSADPARVDGSTGNPVAVPADGVTTTPDGTLTGGGVGDGGTTTTNNDQKGTPESQAVPVTTSPGTDRADASTNTDTNVSDRTTSEATVRTDGGPVAGPPTDATATPPGDGSTGSGRTATDSPVRDATVAGPVDTASPSVTADVPPTVLPGTSTAAPVTAPTAPVVATPPGTVTPTGPTTATNPAPTTGTPATTGPQVANTPNASTPTTTGTPATGTNTQQPAGNTATQPAAGRGTPVNPTAANTAGSISLAPAAGPATTNPAQPTGTTQQVGPTQQPGTPAQQATPAQPAQSTTRPDTTPAPANPLAPTVPEQTAGTEPTTPSPDATPTADTDTDPNPDRTDPAQRTTDGPVVIPVPTSSGTVQGGPTNPAPETATGPVDPQTLKRSEGPTGRGTHSWQLAPTSVDGDPNGPEAEHALIEASRTLAETVRREVKAGTISKGKQPGMAGALLMPDGSITTHTSMTADRSTKPPTQPRVHPLAQATLDRIATTLVDGVGGGHGKCAEVALVSDQLYLLEQRWRSTGEPGTFEQYALDALQGAKIVTHQVKQARSDGFTYDLGHYRPPCRSCAHFLPQFNVEPISDPDRDVSTYRPPVLGAVGAGPSLSDSRPYGQPEGLIPPDPTDQRALEDAVPADQATGRPSVHPDPRGQWTGLINDGGPTVSGRDSNCADVGLSVLSTWFGRPEVAAPTAPSTSVETGSTGRQERALGAPFTHQGSGTTGLDAVAEALRAAGPGSAALIVTSWADGPGAHTWNAVNHDGTIIWLDGQNQMISESNPLHAARVDGVWSIVLDAEGDPIVQAVPEASTPAPVPPASTADVPAGGRDQNSPTGRPGAVTDPNNPDRTPGDPTSPDGTPADPNNPVGPPADPNSPDQTPAAPSDSGVAPGSPDPEGDPDPGREGGTDPDAEVNPDPASWPDMQGWPMPDTRQFGPEQLAPLEDPQYQDDVEDSLRTPEGYEVFADPSTHPYGQLINDGGPDQPGRANNCVDTILAALASFYGDPQVSHPRWPDRLDDGTVDTTLGELNGFGRIESWIGGEWTGDNDALPGTPAERSAALADQYEQLYQRVRDAGPGAAAVVAVDWIQFDENTGDPLLDPEGNTMPAGEHVFLLVYPEGADGPVWWDPQFGSTTTDPLPGDYVGLTHNLWSMEVQPTHADEQGGSPATDDQVAGDGQPGSGVPVRVRLGSPGDALPAAAEAGPATGPGGLHHRPDRSGDRTSQPATTVDHETVRGGPPGGPDHRPAGLAGPGSDGLSDAGAAPDGDPVGSPYLDGLPDTDRTTLLDALTEARTEADQILADLHSVNAEVNAQLGLTGTDSLSTLGEQHRVKGAESLARKYRTELEPLGYDIGSALDTVNDVVRFSVRGPESEAYGPAVDALLASLEAQGYQVTDLKNFWHPGNRFFGLNCTLTAPSGRTFELQFPTETSYNVGKQTHDQYEVMRDPAQSPAARVHAFLDILAVNKANGIAASMPGGMDSARFDTPKDTSFAKWMASPRQASIRESYLDWLGQQGLTFADVLAARGLAASDLPGLDPDLMGGVHGTADLRLLPPPETGRSGRPAGKPDRGGGQRRTDPGGDLGSTDPGVDVPPGRGGGDPVGESGTPRDSAGRPGDGRAPGGALRDGAVADGGRADGDLPLGGLTAELPGGRPSSVPLDTDHGLAQTRRLGPGELAPLEDPGHQWDVEQSLRTPDGYLLFADPSTHPYGQLVNDGGPDQPGRANNCLDSSLSALSSFFGDPRVSFPRWPDVRPDGTIETVTGEASGLDRAEEWLGTEWSGGSEGLPTTPAEHAAAVAEQYAQLHQRVAEAGPGSAALVVAEWVRTDPRTGELVLDQGQVQVQDSHAFVLVYPEGADGPVWWDPQRGTTWPQPPAAYLSQTYALWSMETMAERVSDDGGRGADADQTPAGHGERDRAAPVRVRLAGEGAAVTTGTGGGQTTGSRELHHRPDGSDHSSDESAGTSADLGVHAGPPGGPDDGSAGLADGGSNGLTPPVGTAGDVTPSGVDGPPPSSDSRPVADPDGPDLRQAAAGTTFGGTLLDADPGRTSIAVEAALTTGPLPDGASADPATATVTLTTLDGPYPVRVELTPAVADASVVPVATIHHTPDGAVVQVSTSAHPDHVRRAVAAALAEVDTIAQQRAEGLRFDATTALAEGARPEGDGTRVLTARDIGHLAELRVVLADSSAATDPGIAGQLRAEALSLLVASGLLEQEPVHVVHGLGSNTPVVGPEAARARLDLIHDHLGPLAAEVESLIGLAQSDGQQLVADIRAAQSAVRAEARAWAQQATELRDQADLALTARVDATLGVAPDHVFDRLVIGGGWAATADFVTMGAAPDAGHGLPPVLCVSQGHDPWAERQALLMGQVPSELEIPGLPFQPGDLAEEGTQFTPSDVFADAVGAARALSGMPTYQGTATSITPRPADATGWPDGANFRVTVNGRDFYTTSVDIASGPGPSRVPSVPADAAGTYVDPTSGYRVDRSGNAPRFQDPDGNLVAPESVPPAVRAVLGGAGTSRGDLPLLADLTGRPTDPLVVDPTSGYAVDLTTGRVVDSAGTPVDAGAVPAEVGARLGFAPDGSFRDPRPSTPPVDFGGQNLADAYRPGDRVLVFGAGASGAWDIEQAVASPAASVDWSARAMEPPPDQLTGDPDQDAEARLRHSFGGGYNRRNTLPDVGAYADTVQSQVDRSLREIVSLRHTVDGGFQVEFTDGSRQTYDRVVLSIGQAAEFPGGVANLLPDMDLAPIEGLATEPVGPADVLGLQDDSGQLRILGAASVAGPVISRVDETVEGAIRRQAAALPSDSRGIAPSIRFHAQRIAEANRPGPSAATSDGPTLPGPPSGPDASDLFPADTEPVPSPLDVEPGQGSVPGDQFLPERGHLDRHGLPVDVLSVAPGGDLDGVASQVDVAQGGQVAGGGQGFGSGRTDAAAGQTQPAQPAQVRGVDERGEPVVADQVSAQVEGDQAVEAGDLGDLGHESGGLDQDQVADGMVGPDLVAVVDEGAGGHGDRLDQAIAGSPVDEQVGDGIGEARVDPPVQKHDLSGVADSGEVETDQRGVFGVGGFDGVGVAPSQVEVVGVGEDGGVEVGGRGHDGSVSTDGAVGPAPAPSLPESRRFGPGELAPLEDPRFQDDLAASLATPQGYAVFADPSTHPYGLLVNDGGPEQPGRANNCLDSSLAALASFHGDPQVSVPRWADRFDDGSIDRVSGERGGLERAEAWIGGQWLGGTADLPTDLSARTDAVAAQYADLHRQVAEAGPGASALVVADWLFLDPAGNVVLDETGQPEVDGSHAFVIVFPADADAPVWWDPQTGTTSAEMPAADVRETHALWAMMVPDGEGRVDRGRGADTDQPTAADRESDSASGVRVRLAGPGETLGAGAGLGDARGPGELHHRPVGSDHSAHQPATASGDGGVRAGATRGQDQGPAGVARGGPDGLTRADGSTPSDEATGDTGSIGPGGPPGPGADPTAAADGPDLRRAAAGTTFGGALLDADPVRTGEAVQAALNGGPLPDGAHVDPATGTVTLDTLDGPYRVRIELAAPVPDVSLVPVATVQYDPDGAVVQVSTGAHPDHVHRAVAAALAEVDAVAQDRSAGLRIDATTALAEGARPEGSGARTLTARDMGRLAELRVVLADSATTSDPARAGQLRAEALSLLISSGLLEQEPLHPVHGHGDNVPVVGSKAAQARLDLIRNHLGTHAPELDSLVGLAQSDGQQLVAELRATQSAVRAEARAWAQQATALRNEADLALTARVDAALDATPDHVFGRLVIGGGWAATADFVTLGAPADPGTGLPPVLCVSQGHDPWAERQTLLMGQVPSELELPGLPFQPSDLAEAGTQFTPSDVFADAVGAARALSGMPTYQGLATSVTPRPTDAAGWPAGANFRVTIGGREVFTASLDIATGPGPSRLPSAPTTTDGRYVDPTTGYRVDRSGDTPVFHDPAGAVVDPGGLPPTVRAVLGGTGTGASDLPLLTDLGGRPTDPLIVDPSSGHAVDILTGQVQDRAGVPVDPRTLPEEVAARLGHAPDGSFTDPRPAAPAVDFGGQNLADTYQPGDRVLVYGAGPSGAWDIEQAAASMAGRIDWSAQARPLPADRVTGDPVVDARAQLEFSFSGGDNRRNNLPGLGAYSDAARARVADMSLRSVVGIRHTVDGAFVVSFSDGTEQVYDRVVLSIGQEPRLPGGVHSLLSDVELSALEGPSLDVDNPVPDVLGLRDDSGRLRVLGGAGVAGALLAEVGRAVRRAVDLQADALPDDSRGIPPSIRFHAQRIAEANRGVSPTPSPNDGGSAPLDSPSDLVPADNAEQRPAPLGVEPRQRAVALDQLLPEGRHLDPDGRSVDVLPVALSGDLNEVVGQVDVAQGGQVAGGSQGLGSGPADAAPRQAQPTQPAQVGGLDQRGEPVVTDQVPAQIEGDQAAEAGDLGDLRHESGGLDQDQVADGMAGPDLLTVVDEGAGGHGDRLDQAVAQLPRPEQVGDRLGEPGADPSVQEQRLPGAVLPGQVEADQLGALRVGGLDGVGVASPQVEVVGVGEDGGVEVGGRGHEASVSTGGSITAGAVPGSTFHGLGRPAADPAAVLDLARSALPLVAPYAQVDAVVAVGPDLFEIRSAGQYPLTVRLTSGPLSDGLVARSSREPDGAFTVTLSDRAADQVVARALAHEVAELVALHESGRALVGPLDPGNVHGPIDPAGLTAHDRGRMAEIRLLAATYADADPAARPAVRAEIDALAGHLGLRVGDPDVRSRWALIPRDVLAHLMQLSVPSITPDAVSAVLAGAATLTEVERIRMIDYRARLAPDFQVPPQADLDARLRELASEAEHAQAGMPRMPAFAGQIVGIPPAQLGRIRAVDPQLADRLATEGIYVDLTGRYDLRPYMVPSVPAVDLGAARPAFDLTTEAGRRAQLHEDRQRARAALRGLRGDQAAALLTGHDFHYQGTARWMGLVPDVLTDALRSITPAPTTTATTVENSATQETSGEIRVAADRVTLPPESASQPGPVYGPALDARTGQPPPLFDGPPKREDVQQGALGDCGMIAVIGSVAGQLPDTVAQMFHPNPDGSVDVVLHETGGPGRMITPTGRQLRVTVFPDVPLHPNSNGHSAYADQSVVGASWASLLEKAIAAIDRTWTQQRHDQWQQQWTARPGVDAAQAAPLGYARLDNGSSRLVQAELLSQLTGLPTGVSELDPTPGREAAAEARLAALLAAGSPLITGTRPADAYASQPGGKPPYGLVAGHAYEIVAVANGEVQLRNPWNSRHPAPMPLRAFLDLMSPWYAHVEPARSTVAALPGSEFHGQGRPAADAPAVLDRARTVLPTLAEPVGADQIVAVGPDVFEVRAPGLEPLRVRVTAAALGSGVVAQTIRNLDGTFTLTVSDRASDLAVDRAVAHEAAELLARHETGEAQSGLFDQGATEVPIDPGGISVRDRGRLAELRLMAAWYAQADPAARLALRAEIDTLVDRLGLRWGTPDAAARLAVLPADVWTQVMQLSLPVITPEAVASALAFNPNQTMVERFRAIDYRGRLAPDFQPPPAADLAGKLRELAVHGEQSQSSLPRMPALAGQLIGLPPNLLDQVRKVDPQLADRIAAEGIYVDLTGRFDLRPYTLDGAPEFNLERSTPAYDLNTPAGRHALLTEDRTRTYTAFNVEYGSNPAAMAVLATHSFHYQSDARRMALVPTALTEALRAMMPSEPDAEVEVIPTVTPGEVAVAADRVTLPDPKPKHPVEYGRPLFPATGQPAPLFDGPPGRTQVQQGILGDCGMLATMAALAGHRPQSIPQLFQPKPDGTVDVLLHESVLRGDESVATGRRIRINVRPDIPVHAGSSWAAYADQSEVGVGWAAVLEKALAAVDRTWTKERHEQWQSEWRGWESKDDPHRAAPLGYARLNVGSTTLMQAELLTQLTGLPARQTLLDTTPGREAAVERHLTTLLAAGSPITIATWSMETYPGRTLPHGLKAKHVYEILAVRDGQVQLRNPWNKEHPSPMSVREMLDLMQPWCAHLEQSPVAAPPSPSAYGGSVANVQPLVPSPRTSAEQIVGRPLAVPSPNTPLIEQPGPLAKPASPPRTLGRTHLDDERYAIDYFALLAGGGSVAGLMVFEVGGPGRSLHWTAGGVVPGQATPAPVDRAEAERIARDVLGFVLPAEPTLYDMLDT
ncbi:toxin glutamine deamidase domain-containing protein [Micromonospora sp. NPDC049891]|uniref:toxin glutamine deamidase domain-containing protein n=1 Tax=Micromonospora sp. NPDC049891 TaxID=3155655 RepID=UPI0033D15CA2